MHVLPAEDVAYVRRNYLTLEALASAERLALGELEGMIAARVLPGPSYVLPSGEAMFPRDLCGLLLGRCAGGGGGASRSRFLSVARWHGPVSADRVSEEWSSYLSGVYGVCLRQVTPETVFIKEWLVSAIDADLQSPEPDSAGWRRRMCEQVEGLDALLRPFATSDRIRFGRPTSRERCIEVPRARYPWLV
jgi:hypothetical protein